MAQIRAEQPLGYFGDRDDNYIFPVSLFHKINYFKANKDVDRRSCFARLFSSIKVVILVCVFVPFGMFLAGFMLAMYEGQSSDLE